MRVLFGLLSAVMATSVSSRDQPKEVTGLTPFVHSSQTERSWVQPPLCAKDEAWKAQFLCAKRFHGHLNNIEKEKAKGKVHEVCSFVSGYYDCLDEVLHERSCAEESELVAQAEYFSRVLTKKYSEMCSKEMGRMTKRLKVKVLRTLDASHVDVAAYRTCHEENATREFFACGLLFNMIVSRGPPKDRTCSAYKDLETCTRNLQCDVPSEFNVLSMHVLEALLSPYSHFCDGFQPPTPHQTGSPTHTRPFATDGPCDEGVYLEKYFHCGLTFIFSLRDARFQDDSQLSGLVCDLARIHKLCVDTAKRSSNCPTRIGIQSSLDFLDHELRTAPGHKCPLWTVKRIGKTRVGASLDYCSILGYSSTYFTCGVKFLQGTYPSRPDTGEDCRLYNEFLACVEKLVVCRSQSDIEPSFKHFTAVLTDGYTQTCKGFNRSETCDRITLLKNFFSCGLTFYQSYNTYLQYVSSAGPEVCKILGDFTNCTQERVLMNTCGFEQLFANIREVRDYIAKRINQDQKAGCSITRGVQKNLAALVERQSSCDRFAAVRRLVLCGVAFHRMLGSFAEANASIEVLRDENATTTVCPLVKEMKYCMYSATQDSGCSAVRLLSSDISMLKNHLLREFDHICNALPRSDNGTHPRLNGEGCELKEFTEEWEACDTNVKNTISDFYKRYYGLQEVTVSSAERQKICRIAVMLLLRSGLTDHLQCLSESAVRHRCSPLVSQLSDMRQRGMLERLGSLTCASSRPCLPAGHQPALFFAATTAHLLALLRTRTF